MDASLARLKEETRPPASFVFAVAGDTRDSLPYVQSPVFETVLTQVNDHKPALLALLGDMIRGYNITTAPRQWDSLLPALARCQTPVFATPGNHDIWNQASGQLWQERLGPRWYSVDYAGAHFIFLDTEGDATRKIGGDQLAWLSRDLEAAKEARLIFVFLHRPLFLEAPADWQPIHDLLHRYPVKAVFAADYHRYEMLTPWEGIDYYITGGGGAEIADPPEVGGFHHWLLVYVEEGGYHVVVMKPEGGSLAADSIQRKNRAEILAARQEIGLSRMEAKVGQNLDAAGYIRLENRARYPLSGKIEWQTPSSDWPNVPPARWKFEEPLQPYSLPAYSKARVNFHVATETPAAALGALPYLTIDYGYGQDRRPVKLTRGLPLLRTLDIPRAKGPVVPDGKLDEWAEVQPLALQNRLGSQPANGNDLSVSAWMMWEPKRFYLALQVKDDVLTMPAEGAQGEWDVDHLRLVFDPFDNGRGPRGQARYEYLACETAAGPRLFMLRTPAVLSEHRIAPNVQMGVSHGNGVRTYEFVFDESSLSPLDLTAGDKFALNILAGDDDGPRQPDKFTLLTLVGTDAMVTEGWPRVLVTLKP